MTLSTSFIKPTSNQYHKEHESVCSSHHALKHTSPGQTFSPVNYRRDNRPFSSFLYTANEEIQQKHPFQAEVKVAI